MRNITKGFDILIILIVYDNKTYYDVVNDVRKAININKHMILYEYNKVNIIIWHSNCLWLCDSCMYLKGIIIKI